MAANVTFNINAIDNTRKVFSSVDQGVRNLNKNAGIAQKSFMQLGRQFFGLTVVAASVVSIFKDVASNTEKIPGIKPETLDSWNRLRFAASATGNSLKLFVAESGAGLEKWFDRLNFIVNEANFGTANAVEKLQKSLKARTDAANAALKDTPEYIAKATAAQEQFNEARKRLRLTEERETVGERVERLRDEANALLQLAGQADNSADAFLQMAKAMDLRNEAAKISIDLEDKAAEANDKRILQEREIDNVFKNTFTSLRELNEERKRYVSILEELQVDSPEASQYQISINNRLIEIDKERLDLMKRQRDIADQVGSSIASGFEEAILSGGKLRDVLKGILQDIIRIIIRQTITTPLASAISGGITGFFGGATSTATPVPARAMGGPVAGGSSYLVGERGPELFTPSQAGRIIPNHDMQNVAGGGSGQSFTFIYNVAAGVTKLELLGALKASEQGTISKIRSQRARSAQPFAMA